MSQKLMYSSLTAVDGFTGSSAFTWVDLLAGNGNVSGYTSTGVEMRLTSHAIDIPGAWDNLRKGIYLFDPSPLPTGSVIQSGSFSCVPAAGFTNVFLSSLVLANAPVAAYTSIANSDYQLLNAAKVLHSATRHTIASLVANTRITFPLNAQALVTFQSLYEAGNVFELSTMYDWDFDEVDPGWQASISDSVTMYGWRHATVAYRPILTINYYVGGGYATIHLTCTKATGADVLTVDNWAVEIFT